MFEIVRPGMEDSESAEKQENTGIGPASACRGESAAGRRRAVCMVNFAARDVRPHPEERGCRDVSQTRTRVRASRRMRTSDSVCPHASRRIAARWGWGGACARVRAAMLLSMRGDGAQHILAERSHLAGDTNLRLWKSGAGWMHCFGVVLYNESCNPNVSSRQRLATAWECRRVRSPPPICRCRRRGGLSTPRACWLWLRSRARRSVASPRASPRSRESPCSRAR